MADVKDERRIIVMLTADIRGDLGKLFLQHIRDFDFLYPDCHFGVSAVAPDHTAGEIAAMIEVTPPFSGGVEIADVLTDTYIRDVCRIGQGVLACRYLVAGANGFECAKLNASLNAQINSRAASGEITARGDNCEGKPWGRP